MLRRKGKDEDVQIWGGAAWGGRVDDGFEAGVIGLLQPHEYPDERTIALARQHFPEAQLSDFEIIETGPGRVRFRDRATGEQYLRDESLPLEALNPKATGIVCFVIDGAGKIHYLRPRAPREPEKTIPLSSYVVHGPLKAFQ